MNYVRRFVFVHYDDLLEVRFRQLEKVTDKLYVFVPESVADVPLALVRQMQDMGRDLAWVSVGAADYDEAQLLIAFQVGMLHEKADPGVEFAILSDSPAIDVLVAQLQTAGRRSLRVRQRATGSVGEEPGGARQGNGHSATSNGTHAPRRRGSGATGSGSGDIGGGDNGDRDAEVDVIDLDAEYPAGDSRETGHPGALELDDESLARLRDSRGRRTSDRYEDLEDLDAEAADSSQEGTAKQDQADDASSALRPTDSPPAALPRGHGRRGPLRAADPADSASETVAALADDVVRNLIRSGNRPAELSGLQSYILLHSREPGAARHVDAIITRMRRKGEIQVEDTRVRYGF